MARLEIGGRRYDLVMSVHAMEQIEKDFGDIKGAMEAFKGKAMSVSVLKKMFVALANAGRHARREPEDVTGEELDDLGMAGLARLSDTLRQAMEESMHAETVNGGLADDTVHDVYAEQMETQEKNG